MKRAMFVGVPVLVALVSGFLFVAHAGNKYEDQVFVEPTLAAGALGSARNSPDASQYIGCSSTSDSSGARATCSACAWGTCKTCTTRDAKMISNARSLKGDGYVQFQINGDGTCATLDVFLNSYNPPKIP